MSHLHTPSSSHKRKREITDDMADNTPRESPYSNAILNFFAPLAQSALEIFSVSTKKVLSLVTTEHKSKRRLREPTLGVPGAFPPSPKSDSHSNKPAKLSQNPRTKFISKELNRNRNSTDYWQNVASELRLEPALQNLKAPSPFPPGRKVPTIKPLRRSGRNVPKQRLSGFRSRQETSLQRQALPTPRKSIVSAKSKQNKSTNDDILDDLKLGVELDDIAQTLPEFRRSLKLERKAERKVVRARSPGLELALKNATRDYLEKKKQEEAERLKPKPPPKLIPSLPNEVLSSLPNLRKLPADQELNKFGRNPIRVHDLLSLRPDQWLNDEVINCWFWELCDKAKTLHSKQMAAAGTPVKDDTPRYHAFNTMWWPTMAQSDWANKVPRWAKRFKVDGLNLLKVHKILIPLHEKNHWTLLVILPQRRTVRYYNSLSGNATPYLNAARNWISHELGNAWNEEEWSFEFAKSGQQINMSDCGVYSCCNALATFYSDSPSQILPSGPMLHAREFMKFILIEGGFKDEYELIKIHPHFQLENDRSVSAVSKKGKEKAK